MNRQYLITIFFVAFATVLSAQETVTFYVQPAESFVRVDGQLLDLTEKQTLLLDPGTYRVEMWAPNFEVREVTILVEKGKNNTVREGLRTVSATYTAYRDDLSIYNTRRLIRVLGEGSIAALSSGLFVVAATGRNKKLDEVRDYTLRQRTLYDDGVYDGADQHLRNYNNGVAEFEEVQQQHNVLVVASAIVATVGVAVLFKRFTSKKRTKYVRPTLVQIIL